MPPREAAAATPADAAASCLDGGCSRGRPRRPLVTAGVLAGLLQLVELLAGCRQGAPPPAVAARDEQRRPPAAAQGGGYPRVHIRNVHMMFDPEVVLEVRELYGRMQPTRHGEIPFFDDPTSFHIEIESATTAISTASMAALLNHYTFAYPGAPLAGLTIEPRDGRLLQRGTLHKKVDAARQQPLQLSRAAATSLLMSTSALRRGRPQMVTAWAPNRYQRSPVRRRTGAMAASTASTAESTASTDTAQAGGHPGVCFQVLGALLRRGPIGPQGADVQAQALGDRERFAG